MRPFLLRLQASLLAFVFIAGSFGLPEADVFLDHGLDRGPSRYRVHLESTQGCGDHADHCILGRLLAESRDLLQGSPGVSPIAAAESAVAVPDADLGCSSALPLSYRSRAPPRPA